MISHLWASVKQVALGFIHFLLRFIELENLESDMSKVHTYQLSARQWLQLKCILKWEITVDVSHTISKIEPMTSLCITNESWEFQKSQTLGLHELLTLDSKMYSSS